MDARRVSNLDKARENAQALCAELIARLPVSFGMVAPAIPAAAEPVRLRSVA